MSVDAIILAGGFGTRLKDVVKDVPKPMAPVNNKPFVSYLFNRLIHQNFKRIIFSVGYKQETIEEYFRFHKEGCDIVYAREDQPLGTGGAIMHAMQFSRSEIILICNGDTFFEIDFNAVIQEHLKGGAGISICVKKMFDTSRYGTVKINDAGRILKFIEKKANSGEGLINAGVYVLNKKIFEKFDMPMSFSIEKNFFEAHVDDLILNAILSDAYFIDIGIPDDYAKANEDFKRFEG